jgi:hypothetical protein
MGPIRRWLGQGTWPGYLFAALWLLIMVSLGVRAAQEGQWAWFTGLALVFLVVLIAAGRKRLSRMLDARMPRLAASLRRRAHRRAASAGRRSRLPGGWSTGAPWSGTRPEDMAEYEAEFDDPPEE